MRKIVGVILTITMTLSLLPIIVQADSEEKTYGDLKYVAYDDYVEIVGYIGEPTEIEMPSEIDGLPVTSIGLWAFNACGHLTEITMPDSITNISKGAFWDCTGLTDIIIPDSVISIGDTIFMNCINLKTVKIGNSVTSIGYEPFSGCTSLTSINIPDSLMSIDTCFKDCNNLINIDVGENNTSYSSIDGIWFNKDKTKLLRYPAGKSQTEYTIPDGVTSVGVFAFSGCSNLTNIIIPDSMTNIGSSAFEYCTNLTSITIPDGVISIGDGTFSDCENLVSITLPKSVTSIGSSICDNTAFYNNAENWENEVLYIGDILITAKQDISGECIVKDGTRYIADSAFWRCSSLESIILPDGMIGFGDSTFWLCKNLKSIRIPESMIKLGYWGFYACDSFNEIYYEGTKEQWKNNLESQGNGESWSMDNNVTIHYNAIGTAPPTIRGVNIIPNDDVGKSVEVQLDTVEYDSTLITLFCNDKTHINNKLTTISAGNTSKTFEIPDNADNVKVFIWDSLEGMRPLCEAKTKSIE